MTIDELIEGLQKLKSAHTQAYAKPKKLGIVRMAISTAKGKIISQNALSSVTISSDGDVCLVGIKRDN